MNSRFVNLVVNKPGIVSFSLHRINAATLFHPAGSPVPAKPTMEDVLLPPAEAHFSDVKSCATYFMAFGRNREKILAVVDSGRNFLYDTDLSSVFPFLPATGGRIYRPAMSVAVGDTSIYVLSTYLRQFVALLQSKSPSPTWNWRFLEPPPYMYAEGYISSLHHDDDYDDEDEDVEDKDPFKIASYTVVGDSHIWISTFGAGTYSFDTTNCTWSKQGKWVLPFRGRAEYVPEHKLWFGFSDQRTELICASDLAAVSAEMQPVARSALEDLVWLKEGGLLRKTRLLPLGSGKVCLARFFLSEDDDVLFQDFIPEPESGNNFMVLEGVEVVAEGEGGLRMIRHKCHRYSFGQCNVTPL